MDFYRFIRKHVPGMRILPLSTTLYVPGSILDPKKLRMLGHCREILPQEPEESWEFTHSAASIVYGCITAQRKLRSRVNIMGVFYTSGTLDQDLDVVMDVTDIRGATLQTTQLALQPKINALRRTDRRGVWRQVNNRLVVLESFFAREFHVRFYRNRQLLTQSALEKITKLNFTLETEHQWGTDSRLTVTNNDSVPFGVRGFVV